MTAIVPREEQSPGAGRRGGKARFPRSARLLRHADFERVYKQGRRHFSASMTVFYLARAAADDKARTKDAEKNITRELRVGFTVGRVLGGAVERNRMKRRLREAVRLTRAASGAGASGLNVDVVINPKKSLLTAEFADVLSEVERAFGVIEKKCGSSSSATNKTSGSPELEP